MSDAEPGREPLARAWVAWIAENALRGASRADLAAGLVAGGVPAERATAEVDAVLRSPILDAARALVARSAGVEQACRLRRTLDDGPLVERSVDDLDAPTFHRDHWRINRPVVCRGAVAGWPAARWTPRSLAERFGEVEVSVLVGRAASAAWWRDREALVRRMPLAALVDVVEGAAGDDVYADGRTNLLDEPGLADLLPELGALPGLAADGFPKAWIGPAGTLTPLHHDQSTGWFAQLYGRKRVWMASPLEPALMATATGVYNTADPTAPAEGDLAEVVWHTVELDAGDAMLFPVGWWHRVEALTASISVSFGRFRWPNALPWYTPGARTPH